MVNPTLGINLHTYICTYALHTHMLLALKTPMQTHLDPIPEPKAKKRKESLLVGTRGHPHVHS